MLTSCGYNFPIFSIIESATPPVVSRSLLVSDLALMQWNHTNTGPCFANLTFSYNITWYPVVGGTGQMEAAESAVASNHNTEGTMWYVITNLLPNTSYQVEIVGFTSTSPQVFSEPVTVGFVTQGNYGTSLYEYNNLYIIMHSHAMSWICLKCTILFMVPTQLDMIYSNYYTACMHALTVLQFMNSKSIYIGLRKSGSLCV